ncbi:Peptidoglycan beta-N-acetylmuramidase NamZ [Candidatus Magnetomoraceae bacterium gMMP-15]
MSFIKTGIEIFAQSSPLWMKNQRLGLLLNPASVDRNFCSSRDLINKYFPGQLCALFSPQHGYYAAKQDNMIESNDILDPVLQIPVFSLYGKTRIPSSEMFEHIDILLIDLQDVGTRVYTFIYTMSYCLEAAKKYNKKVVILDRPNPLSGIKIEGNCLSPEFASFVGRYPIPMQHGLTIGELALLFNSHYGIGCDLKVIPMQGWKRSMYFNDTMLPWVMPSPNLPTYESALVYPGQVLWEGTNVSEGRGTAMPFEIFGAPYLNTDKVLKSIRKLPGVHLRTVFFEPTSNKWQGQLCQGFQIHIINRDEFQPYLTSLKLIQAVIKCHPEDFKWKLPPYEYEFTKMPIDLILGSKDLREYIENFYDLDEIALSWKNELEEFIKISEKLRLYK